MCCSLLSMEFSETNTKKKKTLNTQISANHNTNFGRISFTEPSSYIVLLNQKQSSILECVRNQLTFWLHPKMNFLYGTGQLYCTAISKAKLLFEIRKRLVNTRSHTVIIIAMCSFFLSRYKSHMP